MKTILFLITTILFSAAVQAQTMFIDYSERSEENTAAIHIMEAKQTIETEEFDDIITAKTKLIRIIENYRTDGYEVKSSNVSTHKHGKSFHYHYQYILQQNPLGGGERTRPMGDVDGMQKRERLQKLEGKSEKGSSSSGASEQSAPASKQEQSSQPAGSGDRGTPKMQSKGSGGAQLVPKVK
ncbi:MAG: hypothetical protein HQ500_13410 [Flavobacteriales bacterium]|nr:hypothetical protein [Flavobacteriales bacterium]